MNREIKFRLWYYDQEKFDYNVGFKDFKKYSFPLYWCCVQQWTGLKDNNGVEIYEGDILKLIDHKKNNLYGEVYFGSGAFHVKGVDCLWFGSKHGKCEDYEIIGNIMENPELLKA